MKLSLLLSVLATASAFQANPQTNRASTKIDVSTTGGFRRDDWSDKPLYEKKSTTPVAARKVGPIDRMRMKDVVIPPDFTMAWYVAALGPLIALYHPCKYSIQRIHLWEGDPNPFSQPFFVTSLD